MQLSIRPLRPTAIVPAYMTANAAGLDLAADIERERIIQPGAYCTVPTGLALAIPVGYEGQVRPRSGLAAKHGVTVLNAPGTIDADYRGEVMVILINHGREPFVVTHGMRIAQLVVTAVVQAELVVVANLDSTVRGDGGFGSTGTK